jgi:hypothetical protein
MANGNDGAKEATPAPPPAGHGPGNRYVSVGWTVGTAVYLVLLTALSLYAIVKLWPHPTPTGDVPAVTVPVPPAKYTGDVQAPPASPPAGAGNVPSTPPSNPPATNTMQANQAGSGVNISAAGTTGPPANKPGTSASSSNPPGITSGSTSSTGSITTAPPTLSAPCRLPTQDAIKARQDALCGISDKACRDRVAKEMTQQALLRAESACCSCLEKAEAQQLSPKRKDPECARIFGIYFVLWQEDRLLLLVFLAGAVGALLHALRALVSHAGNRDFIMSWLPFYFLWPFAGSMIAFVTYILIRGGFFSSTATTEQTSPFMFVALAALSGLFSQQVLEKLKKIADTTFGSAPPSSPAGPPPGKPVIVKLSRDTVPVGFEGPIIIDGTGFSAKPAVRAGGVAMTVVSGTDTQVTFTLPKTSTSGTPPKLDIVVTSVTGAASDPKQITVTP